MTDLVAAVFDPEPIHGWFELSYASYLVLHRSILQSMPVEWQGRFVALLQELDDKARWLPDMPSTYRVNAINGDGKFVRDPYRDYERGRRLIQFPEAPR